MIRIGYYCHNWDERGTAACLERIIQVLDKTQFLPFVFYWPGAHNPRLHILKKYVGADFMVPFSRSQQKTGPEEGYSPLTSDFETAARNCDLDIMHVARGGYYEWPLTSRICKAQVETNIFGYQDKSGFCDHSMFISNYVKMINTGAGKTVYIPIPEPKKAESLRAELRIPSDAIVCGRIGGPGNFHPIGLNAFHKLAKQDPNIHFIYQSPCAEARKYVEANKIPRVIFLELTQDDHRVTQFWNAIDIFCHARADGEAFGSAIAEAMSYGVPVVSHRSGIYDAHVETIGGGGSVFGTQDGYESFLVHLVHNPGMRKEIGDVGRAVWYDRYHQNKVVKRIESLYKEWACK